MKRVYKILPIFSLLLLTSCQPTVSSKVTLGSTKVLKEPAGVYFSGYWPDGKLNLVKKDDIWQLFWGEAVDILTENESVWPEDHYSSVKEVNAVFGKGKSSIENFNENGSWFIGVFPLDEKGNYVGFFHGESHWDNDGTAHKSIGVTYSSDYGKTWKDTAPIILAPEPKGEKGWTGLGDACVIWDHFNERWLCYYQARTGLFGINRLCLAASYDPQGKPGTWKKWDGNSFSGYGCDSSLKGSKDYALANLKSVPGCNPSVMWNEYLNKWVMVYGSWGKEIYISFSDDGINWSSPEKILGSSSNPVWYPNLISEEGDKTGGKTVRMYYSYQQSPETGRRKMAYNEITFEK